jgi:hypothetical protein
VNFRQQIETAWLGIHPSLAKIAGIVRHHWKEIQKSETLAKLFPEPPVVAFRRPKSIKAVSICCLKFTRKTIRGDRLYQPMVTQLKRYRNLLIFTFGRSLKTFHHTLSGHEHA